MKFWCLVMAASYSLFCAFSRFWSSFWNLLLKLAESFLWCSRACFKTVMARSLSSIVYSRLMSFSASLEDGSLDKSMNLSSENNPLN